MLQGQHRAENKPNNLIWTSTALQTKLQHCYEIEQIKLRIHTFTVVTWPILFNNGVFLIVIEQQFDFFVNYKLRMQNLLI